MENTPRPSTWKRTTTRRFLRWLRSRTPWIAAAWIVSLIALAYGVIDWHDSRAWNAYRENYEAHVASLDLQTYIPKPVPDSENFAATPFAESWMKWGTNYDTNFLYDNDAYFQADKMKADPPKLWAGARYVNHFQDLAAWEEAFAAVRAHAKKPRYGFWSTNLDLTTRAQAAPAILDALKDDQAAFDELRAASAQPEARYPVAYNMENPWATLLPHLGKIKVTCLRLSLNACAELAVSQGENALDDIKLMLYLGDTPKTEPWMVSYLVRIACVQITMQPIREGLAERRWNDTQLEQLQTRLNGYNFVADMQLPLHAEEAGGVSTVDILRKKGLGMLVDYGDITDSSLMIEQWQKPLLDIIGKILPSGWYDQEKLQYSMRFEDEFRGAVDETTRRFFPGNLAVNVKNFQTLTNDTWGAIIHHEMIARLLLPALQRVPLKAAAAQTATDQAFVACALERYRLANGQYPDSLDALVPRFASHLPNDVITGEPFKYRRTDDGQFVLYSVGWNEKDDGGVARTKAFDESEGDWVWQYP